MEDLLKLKPKDPIQFIIDYIDLGPTCATQVGSWMAMCMRRLHRSREDYPEAAIPWGVWRWAREVSPKLHPQSHTHATAHGPEWNLQPWVGLQVPLCIRGGRMPCMCVSCWLM